MSGRDEGKRIHTNNHNHLDTGAFQIYYKGSLALDSGAYQTYDSDHDKNYYKRTIAHNSMLVYNPNEQFFRWGGLISNDGGVKWPNLGIEPDNLSTLLDPSKGYKMSDIAGHQFGPDPIAPDYTYLKGNLTNAYNVGATIIQNPGKVSKYMRSFVFLNLKDSFYPAAMVVYDRVISTNQTFKKYWLLHSEQEPDVNGNVTTITRSTDGYNGKLVNTSLLPIYNTNPLQNNLIIEKVGGTGNEYKGIGTDPNHPLSSTSEVPPTGLEPGKWRVQISPKTEQYNDGFLNVMQVMDNIGGPATSLATELIDDSTSTMVGAKIKDRVVLFSKSGDRLTGSVTFTVTGSLPTYKYVVTDLAAGNWSITQTQTGQTIQPQNVTVEGNALSFNGPAGPYTLTKIN